MLIFLIYLLCAGDSLKVLAEDEANLSLSQMRFSTELFQAIAANTSYTKDVFFSPSSIYSGLLTVYLASAGQTEKSLQKFLRFFPSAIPDKKFIANELLHPAPVGKEYTLTSVDRIYHSPDFKVKKDKESQFGIKHGVFKTKNDRAEEVNKWVSNNTKGYIKNFLSKGAITTASTVVFVNAAYFRGYWVFPITGGTSKKPFTLNDGTVTETQFMSLKEQRFQSMTVPDLKAKVISLPYKGGDLTMIIALPTTKPQKNASPVAADVVKKLTSKKLQDVLTTLEKEKFCTTDLSIPKFQSEEKYELKPIFETLGDKELFSKPLDLTDLFEPGAPLRVDKVLHQAKVNVHENGTVAAAATSIQGMGASPPVCPTSFQADHPFVYMIYDIKKRVIQYIGILNNPKK